MNHSPPHPRIAILLAAGDLNPSLQSVYGQISSAMIPVAGKPVIHWTLSYLNKLNFDVIIIGIKSNHQNLKRFTQLAYQDSFQIHFVVIDEDQGPGGTLLRCMDYLAEQAYESQSLSIVLGDTIFNIPSEWEDSPGTSFVLTNDHPIGDARWCYIQTDESNTIHQILDKPETRPDHWPALIGYYHVDNYLPGYTYLQEHRNKTTLEISDFLHPYVAQRKLKAVEAASWLDCGNMDLLLSSRRRILASRSFNQLEIDELRCTITKRSSDQLKLVNEINYYRLLPDDLKCYFPRVIDHSLHYDDISLTLEYYAYPTLSELWVFEEHDSAIWKRVFQRLRDILERFAFYKMKIDPDVICDFYLSKTLARVTDFQANSPNGARILDMHEIMINGRLRKGWPQLISFIENRIQSLANDCAPCVIHGDLCFSNILYEPMSHAFKFIDVRGSFGQLGLYGDPRYDLAKLLHSVHGGYDFIIHDMFSCEWQDDEVTYKQYFPESRQAILDAFNEVAAGHYDINDIRFLEALLFISMCPLHQDYPSRQEVMLLVGIELMNRLMNNENIY